MGLLESLGTIARGVNQAHSEADRQRLQELEETQRQLEATRKAEEHERGIAKERLGEYRTQVTHAIQRGDWPAADRINRQALTPYNTVMGSNEIGDKLIGTSTPAAPDLRPESLPRPTIDRPAPPKFGIPALPGADDLKSALDAPLTPPAPAADPTGLGAPRAAGYDPATPDYSNPENQRTIMRRAGYAPKPERIELGYGQEAYEREYPGGPWKKIAEADDRPVSSRPKYVLTVGPDGKPVYTEAAPGVEAYVKPGVTRYVRTDNGDGTFSMVPLEEGATYNSHPTSAHQMTPHQILNEAQDTYATGHAKPSDSRIFHPAVPARPASVDPNTGLEMPARAAKEAFWESGSDGKDDATGLPMDQAMSQWEKGVQAEVERIRKREAEAVIHRQKSTPAQGFNQPSANNNGTSRWAPLSKPARSFAPLANLNEADPATLRGLVADFEAMFGAGTVTSTIRDPKADAAKGRAYDSFHHHWKGMDSTPPLARLRDAIQWGVDRGARVVVEGHHLHFEPSMKGYGYVDVKRGDGGAYINAYHALTAPQAPARPAPFQPIEVKAEAKTRRLAAQPAPAGRRPTPFGRPAPDVSEAMPATLTEQAGAPPIQPIKAGNIDLARRPQVKNPDGSISTVRSIGVTFDDATYLLPTVIGNRVVSEPEAIAHFKRTGQHLGAFRTPEESNAYAEWLHQEQAQRYVKPRAPKAPTLASPKLSAFYERHGLTGDA